MLMLAQHFIKISCIKTSPCAARCECSFYLAAACETLVIAGSPAGTMSVILVLKEAGVWIFLQLLGVIQEKVIKLRLLYLCWGTRFTAVWDMHLEMHHQLESDGEGGHLNKKEK